MDACLGCRNSAQFFLSISWRSMCLNAHAQPSDFIILGTYPTLTWQLASEQQNEFFEQQRSTFHNLYPLNCVQMCVHVLFCLQDWEVVNSSTTQENLCELHLCHFISANTLWSSAMKNLSQKLLNSQVLWATWEGSMSTETINEFQGSFSLKALPQRLDGTKDDVLNRLLETWS